jgi:DeoD family purine-nucleoside phosphorylase
VQFKVGSVPATERTSDPSPIHLRPTAALADRVLLPGDPGRALALAQALLAEPRMFNHHRGLWGYTGQAHDGEPLTIQATGMGGPSAAIVLTELIALGARRAIRVGTCGALARSMALGDLVVAREAVCLDGTSRALSGETAAAAADAQLTEALIRAAPAAHAGTIASVDLFYDNGARPGLEESAAAHIAPLAVEMEAATLFALGARSHVAVGCVLVVSDTFGPHGERTRIDDDALLQASERMGAAAVQALSR